MAKNKSEQPVTPDGFSRWIHPSMESYNIQCCDCGLVHNFEMRVSKVMAIKEDGGMLLKAMPKGKYQILFRARRNNRATGQVRRHKKKEETR